MPHAGRVWSARRAFPARPGIRLGRTSPAAAGVPVLDLIYLALTVALFALVGLVAKGLERL